MSKRWHLVISAALTIVIGYLIYRSVSDWGEAWRVMLQGQPLLLLTGFGFVMLHMVLRAWRWGALLTPLKSEISYRNLFSLTLVKYVVNVIPPRVGELAASIALARKERISAVSVFAASIFERVLDMLTVLMLFTVYLIFFAQRHSPDSERGQEIFRAAGNYSMLGLALLSIGFVVLLLMLRSRRWHDWVPALIQRYVLSFMEGFRALHSRLAMLRVILLSILIWLAISAQLWSLTLAYLDNFPITGAVLIMALTVVGVAIPTPGGIGSFQLFMNITLVHFFPRYLSSQDPYAEAAGISNGCYIVSMIPVMLLGLWFLNRQGLSFGRMAQMSKEVGLGGES